MEKKLEKEKEPEKEIGFEKIKFEKKIHEEFVLIEEKEKEKEKEKEEKNEKPNVREHKVEIGFEVEKKEPSTVENKIFEVDFGGAIPNTNVSHYYLTIRDANVNPELYQS